MIKFEQKRLKNRYTFGLTKISDGALQNFSDIKRQIHMLRRTKSSQERRKMEKVKIWPNLAKSLKLFDNKRLARRPLASRNDGVRVN